MEPTISKIVGYLGLMLGLRVTTTDLDRPLTDRELASARANPSDPRAASALRIAKEGWTIRDILYHGVIDYHPAPIGAPEVTADHMQEWFEAGACDGFWLSPDVYGDGIPTFFGEVIPILQKRDLFHTEYEGETLRQHLGVKYQYGLSESR